MVCISDGNSEHIYARVKENRYFLVNNFKTATDVDQKIT